MKPKTTQHPKNKNRHKAKPVIPWMGGKTKLVKKILPYFPEHTCYAEPFAGGASLFFAKERSKCEVLNDQHGELMNLYRVIQHHLEAFLDHFMWMLSSRESFERMKQDDPSRLTDIGRAVRFFYLQKHAFGGLITSQSFGTATVSPAKFNTQHMIITLQKAHDRLKTVFIENLGWQEIVGKYDRPHTLFYMDPPYWRVTGYDCDFPWSEYEELAEIMRTGQGMMILSINDHRDIRKLFNDFKMVELETSYTVGSGKKQAKELLIFNDHAARESFDKLKRSVIAKAA